MVDVDADIDTNVDFDEAAAYDVECRIVWCLRLRNIFLIWCRCSWHRLALHFDDEVASIAVRRR